MKDAFLSSLQNTWKDTQIVHKDLSAKVRKRRLRAWGSLIYNGLCAVFCALAGGYLIFYPDNAAVLFGLFLITTGIPSSVHGTRLALQNLQWSDKNLKGTITHLSNQYKNDIRYVSMTYKYQLTTPVLAIILWVLVYFDMTALNAIFAAGFTVGLAIGVAASLAYCSKLLRESKASLASLDATLDDLTLSDD